MSWLVGWFCFCHRECLQGRGSQPCVRCGTNCLELYDTVLYSTAQYKLEETGLFILLHSEKRLDFGIWLRIYIPHQRVQRISLHTGSLPVKVMAKKQHKLTRTR
ncbi:hypothetical protein L873DRAFT_27656 [Choiromyces venosus 120613-1]|uniref:Uncharacterized protein n=1 Tax=Choiromyces venosus 120613-1 TaxID=1336337 RepID=A0A3N4KA07_9PEZI|nr:hypothetical protein L873DRAFT_27656 [Choiromyces venosus 120613-1]